MGSKWDLISRVPWAPELEVGGSLAVKRPDESSISKTALEEGEGFLGRQKCD